MNNKMIEDVIGILRENSVWVEANGKASITGLLDLDKLKKALTQVHNEAIKACEEAMGKDVKMCRFGCHCPLCQLCDEDTHIHCSDCVMNKPVEALTLSHERLEELKIK